MTNRSPRGRPDECLQEFAALGRTFDSLLQDNTPELLMRLSQTIEGEIVPRLMMALDPAPVNLSRPASAAGRATESSPDLSGQVGEFVHLLLTQEATAAERYVSSLRDSGVALPTIYLDLLAPAARRMGEMWEEDECSFTDVTVGVCRMHQVLLQFSPCFCASRPENADGAHSVMVLPLPGEQHTFGLFMVVEFFRRAGWNVWSGTVRDDQELVDLVRSGRFDVVGFSLASDRHCDRLAESIRQVRRHSLNPEIKILVGGRAFLDNPDRGPEVGADAVASDGQEAVEIAATMVDRPG